MVVPAHAIFWCKTLLETLRLRMRLANSVRIEPALLLATILLAASANAATLSGRLGYPGTPLPAMMVVARDVAAGKAYTQNTARGQSSYRLEVPAGTYIVFAVPDGVPDPKVRGAYTLYSVCARDTARLRAGGCSTGPLVSVRIREGDVLTGVDIDDWHVPEKLAATLRLPTPNESTAAPRFDAYSVALAATPKPVMPDFASAPPAARPYRSQIEAAAAKGATFAGNVAIARWGCGSACENWALVDLSTGKVVLPGAPLLPLAHNLPCEHELLEFRVDSRLLLVHRLDGNRVVTHALLWTDNAGALSPLAQIVTPVAQFCAKRR
jgi:hypothetical protein